jgi:hypothetical protein
MGSVTLQYKGIRTTSVRANAVKIGDLRFSNTDSLPLSTTDTTNEVIANFRVNGMR